MKRQYRLIFGILVTFIIGSLFVYNRQQSCLFDASKKTTQQPIFSSTAKSTESCWNIKKMAERAFVKIFQEQDLWGLQAPGKLARQTADTIQTCDKEPPALIEISKPIKLMEAKTCGHFQNRVKQFSALLDQIRTKILKVRKGQGWNGITSGLAEVVWGADDDFIKQLEKYPQVQTIVLPWVGIVSSDWNSLRDNSNLLIQDYYEWTASDPLCKWIETPGTINMKYDATFNRTCNRYTNKTSRIQSLNPVFLNAKPINRKHYWPNNGLFFPADFYSKPPPYVFHVQIFQDAIAHDNGEVFSKNLKLVPYGCSLSRDPHIPGNSHKKPLYDELFIINQYWGSSVFHRMIEIIPRLGSSLEFLQRNPQIKIYCPEGSGGRLGELFRILGLSEDRMVTEWGRANIVYLPRSSMCGFANVQETQLVSMLYRRHVVNHLAAFERNKLILIRRSGSRRFTEQIVIEKTIARIAREFHLEFELFTDKPTPSLNDTMRLFHAAVLVVGPHGAGLSNLVFSQPGTYVVEGVCNLPHVNLCFQRTAVILGHHWHGIPSRGGCEDVVDVAAGDIGDVVSFYLDQWKEKYRSET